MGCEKIINLQQEGGENILNLEREMNVGGAVKSVNGMTGDVVLNTSDLENTSDYQTGSEVESAISTAVGAEATLRENADTALGGRIDNLVTGLGNEITARQTADNSLQGQIDAITASSDVTDIVGTKAQLNNYDTSKLNDNDIIKVLQDESQNDETTYYRWSTATQSFTLIGEEGPYYTKAESNVLLQGKQDVLTAGANINITNNVVSATDTTYSAGNAITIDANNEISADIYPADYFTAEASMTETGTTIQFDGTMPAGMSFDNLYGDSEQQTYSGKNLMPMAISDNTTSRVTNFKISLPAGTHTISFDLSDIVLGSNQSFNISMTIAGAVSGGGNYDSNISGTISSTEATHKSFTFTTTADSDVSANSNIRIGQNYWDNGARAKLSNIQIEAGSTATSFEPYVGGIPAPNPEYPQDVHVVTGEQTVTVSDGTNSQSYTIDLGTTELCKIGDYQDYIYKNGDDWYVHKAIEKHTFNGSEGWGEQSNYNTDNRMFFGFNATNVIAGDNIAGRTGISNNFIFVPIQSPSMDVTGFYFHQSANYSKWIYVKIQRSLLSTENVTGFKNWLANNNMIVYYQKTPTDTQITDSGLISQLDTIDRAHSYNGETNIVISATGTNLPAIAKVTATKNSASGIVKELENAVTSAELDSRMGGLTLLPISQTDYDALSTKDPNTLYVITGA